MTKHPSHAAILHDVEQTPWQLAAIQLTGFASLPVLTTSILVMHECNLKCAILTLLVGNIISFFIRLGIVTMSFKGRKSTLDISKDYVGKGGSYFIAIVLLASTLAWFIAQTTLASNALTHLVQIKESADINQFVQISVALGICSTLLCMEGIVALRWLAVIVMPILLIAFIVAIIALPKNFSWEGHENFSLTGLALVLGTNLGITADLPTFFRHSKSLRTSFKALVIIQVVSLLLGIGALFFGEIIKPWFGLNQAVEVTLNNIFLRIALIILIFVSVVSANVSNVYSASVGWEIVAPKALAGRKEYLILGLGLTIIFILIANIFSMHFLLEITDVALVNLSVVLIISYVIKRFEHHNPDKIEKNFYFIAWALATILNILQFSHVFLENLSTLLISSITIFIILSIMALMKKFVNQRS